MACSRASILTMLWGYCWAKASMRAAFFTGSGSFRAAIYALYSAGSLITFWLVWATSDADTTARGSGQPGLPAAMIAVGARSQAVTKSLFIEGSSSLWQG